MNRLLRCATRPALALILACTAPAVCNAVENMEFTGNLLAPACIVSDNGGRIDVHFDGTIAISKIDGVRYRQTIPYQIKCGESESGRTYSMRLTLQGIATQFDSAAIQTSVPDLGVRILLDGTDFVLNQPRQIGTSSTTNWPALEAVPVKNTGANLASGDFTASALLLAELY